MSKNYDVSAFEHMVDSIDFVELEERLKTLKGLKAQIPPSETQNDKFLAFDCAIQLIEKFQNATLEEELVPEEYVRPEDGMCIVTWPDSQSLMDQPGFEDECILINDEYGLEKYGSSAYWAPESMLIQ